ncbi:MAG: glutaminyl-peptide cyclotransferase [Chlorobiota bacterium]
MKNLIRILALSSVVLLFGFSCSSQEKTTEDTTQSKPKPTPTAVKYPGYEIVEVLPHDSTLFTQGLLFHDGHLYESGGMRGQSRLVRYAPGEEIEQSKQMSRSIFSEGIALLNGKIYMLTYTSGKCLVFDQKTFELVEEYSYLGQGWGLETDGEKLYMTDGSSVIKVINPTNFSIESTISVKINGNKLEYLNELEYIDDYLFANVWQRAEIVKIDIKTGNVVAAYNMSELIERVMYNPAIDVLNGIAYDKSEDVFYLTGKLWPKLFKVKLGS